MTLRFQIRTSRPEYLPGEDVYVSLTLANDGHVPLRIPDPHPRRNPPTLWLEGPGDETERALALGPGERDDVLELAPGDSWTRAVNIAARGALRLPGIYHVRGVFDGYSGVTESNAIDFRVSPFVAEDVRVSAWGREAASSVFVTWIQRAGDDRMLMYAPFTEEAGEDGGLARGNAVRALPLPAGAREAALPCSNDRPERDLFRWLFWRMTDTIWSNGPLLQDPLRVELPAETGPLATLPLTDASHRADLLFIRRSGEASELVVARFRDPYVTRAAPAIVLPPLPLPGFGAPPATVGAAGGPRDAGGARHVVVARFLDGAIELLHTVLTEDDVIPAFTRHVIDDLPPMTALADAPPVVLVEANGQVRVSVAALLGPTATAFVVVEHVFAPIPGGTEAARPYAGHTATGIFATRIQYWPTADGGHRRDWAVWTADGAVLAPRNGQLAIVHRDAEASSHRALAVFEEASYVLAIDPVLGPTLRMI